MILHQHSQEIKLTHQRKGQATRQVSLQGLLSLSLWLCVNTMPFAPSPFGTSPFRCTIVIPAFFLDSLHIQSCQSSQWNSLWSSFSSHPPESITHGTKGQKGAVPLEGSWSVGEDGVWGVWGRVLWWNYPFLWFPEPGRRVNDGLNGFVPLFLSLRYNWR